MGAIGAKMHFDDRLATVLRHRATGSAMARIQYRQLLDLLGTIPIDARSLRIDKACERLSELAARIAPADRVAMLRDPGLRLRNPRIVAFLAGGEPSVAAAAIEQAQLTDNEWIDLAPALPIHARGLLRQRRSFNPKVEAVFDRLGMSQRSLPPAQSEVVINHTDPAPKASDPEEISAIVQRIEDFRRSRLNTIPTDSADDVQRPQAEHPRTQAFDFVTDSSGRVIWCDPGMAPMAVGLQLSSADWSANRQLRNALDQHQPINGALAEFSGAKAIAGLWQIDAKPCFDVMTGAYTGFAGRMRRPVNIAVPSPFAEPQQDSEADRMRQVLHELRTPVGAIQGFAEVIQQQMFGPAPHEYRALAASIASDAARILAGFEELERLARLESGRITAEAGTSNLATTLHNTITQLKPFTDSRNGGFTLTCEPETDYSVAIAEPALERLVWRLMGTIAGLTSPNEPLDLRLAEHTGTITLSLNLPKSMAMRPPDELPEAANENNKSALSTGMFGTSFTLRLASAEAKSVGGSLTRHEKYLELSLPGLTG
jgi:two-component system, OmpR family, sensor kinase